MIAYCATQLQELGSNLCLCNMCYRAFVYLRNEASADASMCCQGCIMMMTNDDGDDDDDDDDDKS